MWGLATVRDSESADLIRSRIGQWENAIQINTARAVLLILEGKETEVLERIAAHDHDMMPWLCRAAEIIGGVQARHVLEEATRAATDEECSSWAKRSLA